LIFPTNIFSEPTPRIDSRQFGTTGTSGGGSAGPLNAEIINETGTAAIATEGGVTIITEQ
jgi:hypothetical protein